MFRKLPMSDDAFKKKIAGDISVKKFSLTVLAYINGKLVQEKDVHLVELSQFWEQRNELQKKIDLLQDNISLIQKTRDMNKQAVLDNPTIALATLNALKVVCEHYKTYPDPMFPTIPPHIAKIINQRIESYKSSLQAAADTELPQDRTELPKNLPGKR